MPVKTSGNLVNHLVQNPYPYSLTPFNFSPGILRSTTVFPLLAATPILDWPLTHFLDGVGSLGGSGAFGVGVT